MIRCLAIAASVLGLCYLAFEVWAEDQAKISWRPEVMEAWRTAQTSQRPLLVYVSLDGCAYCKKMERDTLTDPNVARHVEKSFVAAKIDGTRDATLAKRLGVQIYPTTVIISPENKVLDAIAGYVEASQLEARLQACAAQRVAGGTAGVQ